jgi:hypothetical protein
MISSRFSGLLITTSLNECSFKIRGRAFPVKNLRFEKAGVARLLRAKLTLMRIALGKIVYHEPAAAAAGKNDDKLVMPPGYAKKPQRSGIDPGPPCGGDQIERK